MVVQCQHFSPMTYPDRRIATIAISSKLYFVLSIHLYQKLPLEKTPLQSMTRYETNVMP